MAKSNQKKSYKNKKISFNPLALACALISLPVVMLSGHAQAVTIDYTGNASDLKSTPSGFGTWDSNKANSLFPGTSSAAEASNNSITIDYTSGTDPAWVYGGMSKGLNAESTGNLVTLNNGSAQKMYGGYGYGANNLNQNAVVDVSNNTVRINGGSAGTSGEIVSVCGGCFSNNSTADGDISASANNNSVIVTSGSITNTIWGGGGGAAYSHNGNSRAVANNNKVEIHGGSVAGGIVGGLSTAYTQPSNGTAYTTDATSEYNTVTISDGYVGGKVAAARSTLVNYGTGQTTASISHNTVNISGGHIGGSVYAGEMVVLSSAGTGRYNLSVTDNTVNISGTPTFGSNSSLYGGMISKANNGIYTTNISGNTLNFSSNGVTVRDVDGFQSYNFDMPNTVTDGSVMLNATGSVNLADATVTLRSIAPGIEMPIGSEVKLIQANTLQTNSNTQINNNVETYQGISLKYKVAVEQVGNDSVVARFTEAPQVIEENTKPLAEGRLAGLAYTLQGADLAAEQGIKAALASASLGDAALTAFGTVSGSSSRYNSGSHIDVDGVSMMAGLAWKQDDLVLAGFLEGGKGNYDSYNSFDNAASVHGNGDTSYYGVGILGRYTLDNGIYLDGTARVGQVDTDFNSRDIISADGVNASYDSKSTYYSASIGAGYAWKLNDKSVLDVSTQYLWTHQGSDSVNVAGDPIDFAAANSHRVRTLGRIYQDVTPQVTLMAGLGYEYEFDGEVKGTTYHSYDIDAPSIKGGTGIGELGMSFMPTNNPNFTVDAKLRGYAGKREGYAGFAQMKYAF